MLVPNSTAGSLDSFALSFDRRAGRVLRPRRLARIAARLRARSLDRALIGGADIGGSSQLAARAARLTGDPERRETADGLELVVRAARKPSRPGRVHPSSRAVIGNEAELRKLTALLRGPTPLYAQGVAMLHALLTDGTGPVYTDSQGAVLGARLRDAHEALVRPESLGPR